MYISRNVIDLDSCAVLTPISENVLSAYPFGFWSQPGMLGRCPTRFFNPEVLTFEEFLNGELMKIER